MEEGNINTLFFELIRVSLGIQDGLSRCPSGKEWAQLYSMAEMQSLVGVCFAGVQRLCNYDEEDYAGMPELLYLTWMGMAAKIQQRSEVENRVCKLVEKLFEGQGYWTCIIKGQQVAKYYGHLAALRQPGDIDIWVLPKEMVSQDGDCRDVISRARRVTVLRMLQERPDSVFWLHHIDYPAVEFDDGGEPTEVEVHFTPSTVFNLVKNRKVQRYFERNICRSEHGLTADVDVVFQLMHMRKHLICEGVGMRHVVDFYMTIRTLQGERGEQWQIVSRGLQQTIKELGLDSFARGMMWVIDTVFEQSLNASQEKDNLLLCQVDEIRGRFILDEIMKGGNFGKHNDNTGPMGDTALARTWFFTKLAMRNIRYFPEESLWNPVYRVYVAVWKRWMRRGI